MTTNILEYNYEQLNQITKAKENDLKIEQMLNPEFSWSQMWQIRLGLEADVDVSLYADLKFDETQMAEIRYGMENNIDISIYADPKFSGEQMEEIRRGIMSLLNFELYLNPEFTPNQMYQIRDGLEMNLNAEIYAKTDFSDKQMRVIKQGLQKNLDVSIYLNQKFSFEQMEEIYNGLEIGIDASIYADNIFSWQQMSILLEILASKRYNSNQIIQIRLGLKNGIDVSIYADWKYDETEMAQIRVGLEEGLDVSKYSDPKFDWIQMEEIRYGMENNIDISIYADPKFSEEQMEQLRFGLEDGLDVRVYANEKFDATQMEEIRFQMIDDERNSTYKKSIECVDYLKNALAENFDGKHLNGNIIESATDIYGEKVLKHVLIHAILNKSYDGRINQANKDWASDEFAKEPLYEIPEHNFIIGDSGLENILVNKYREFENEYNSENEWCGGDVWEFSEADIEYPFIDERSENIKVEEHKGTWYVIDSEKIEDKQYFLLEHEEYGDEAANIIVDEQGKLVIDDVWNGFDDLKDFFEENNLNENDTVRYLGNEDNLYGQIGKVTGLYTSKKYIELTFNDTTVLDDVKISNVEKVDAQLYENETSKLTALLIEPMKAPVVVEVENDLKSLQNAVDGNIETFDYYDDICLICNEDGKINGSQLNRAIYDEDGKMVEIIAGSFLVVGMGEEDFKSLSPKMIDEYKNKFEKPEKFTKLAGKIIAQKIDLEAKTSHKPKSNDIDR
ncbi:MAG: DUF3846 domain-containing protein [Clostridia bacterium]